MSAENKSLVRRWFEDVWNKGDASAIDRLFAAHGTVYGLSAEMTGPTGFKLFHAAYRDAFPDVRLELEDLIAEDDKVAFRWTATATHQGSGLGFRRQGERSASPEWASSGFRTASSSKAGTTSTSSVCCSSSASSTRQHSYRRFGAGLR